MLPIPLVPAAQERCLGSLAGAGDDEAARAADAFFERLGAHPGDVESVQPNGPLPMVTFAGGAQVMVAEDGQIASIHAPTTLLLGLGAPAGSTSPTTPPTSTPHIDPDVGAAAGCVDATTQYAPVGVPDGWSRFVFDATPIGTCGGGPFLFMSLVNLGTASRLGTLVTITSQPSSAVATQPGEPFTIAGNPATLQVSVQADGSPASSITMRIGGVSITGHGNVESDTLIELLSTVDPLSDDDWNQLVSEVG